MINTLIAALANTYSLFEHGSQGLYLSKILMSRDELTYDKNYGAFLASQPPFNFPLIFFIPFALYLKKDSPQLLYTNEIFMRI